MGEESSRGGAKAYRTVPPRGPGGGGDNSFNASAAKRTGLESGNNLKMHSITLDAWRFTDGQLGGTPPHDSSHDPASPNHLAPQKRCSHFSVNSVEVVVPRVYLPMRVPIYHCSMAEEMVRRLRTTPEGQWLADKLEATPLDGQMRLVCGPDLEAITITTCVPDRCHSSCRTAFHQVLTDLGLDGAPPES